MFSIPQPAFTPSAPMAVVVDDHHHTHRFRSRQEALSYALRECLEAERRGEHDAWIRIQGSDGQWRTFDCRLMPVYEAEASAARTIHTSAIEH